MSTTSYWLTPTQNPLKHQSDVLVVGAGITGLSLVYWLKKMAPQLSITVVEEGEIGRGASGRNAGFNTAGSTHYLSHLIQKHGLEKARELWRFKQESLRFMREEVLARFDCGFNQWGSTTLYRDERVIEEHFQNAQSIHPGELQRLSSQDLHQKGLKGLEGGLVFPHEASLNPRLFLESMVSELREQGVHFLFNEKMLWSEDQGGQWIGTRHTYQAKQVFLALNGYLSRFAPKAQSWVSPKRAQMVALHFKNKNLIGNFYDPDHKVYFRQDPSASLSTLLVGGMRLLEEETENDDEDKATPIIQHALQQYAQDLFGEKFEVLARWSGVMGFSADELPFMREMPRMGACTYVGGYSGHGMGMAFGVARAAVMKYLGLENADEKWLKGVM